jgi:hypothetical protein
MIPYERQSDSQREKVAELSKQYPKQAERFAWCKVSIRFTQARIFMKREKDWMLYADG